MEKSVRIGLIDDPQWELSMHTLPGSGAIVLLQNDDRIVIPEAHLRHVALTLAACVKQVEEPTLDAR